MNPEKSLNTPEAESRAWISESVPALLLYLLIFSVLLIPLVLVNSDRDERQSCVERGGKRYVSLGVLRQAGPDFFIQADQWRWIAHGCDGKNRRGCIQSNPGVIALENSIGQTISAEFCEKHAISYVVAGQRYTYVTE